MPLVPQTWIDVLTDRRRIIFRSFAYFYQNPLWNKPVPDHFTLCPFFWIGFLFCPLLRFFWIWPVAYLIRPVVRLLHLDKVDEFLFRINPLTGMSNFVKGAGFGLALAVLLLAALISGAVGILVWKYVESMRLLLGAGVSTIGFNLLVFGVVSLLATLISVGIYNDNHKYDGNKCNVKVYVYSWCLIFFVLALALCPATTIHNLACVVWFVGHCFAFVGHWIAVAVGTIWGWVTWLCSARVGGINFVLLSAGMIATTIVFGLIANYVDSRRRQDPNYVEYRPDYSAVWSKFLTQQYLDEGEFRIISRLLATSLQAEGFTPPRYAIFNGVHKALSQILAAQIEELKYIPPDDNKKMWVNQLPMDTQVALEESSKSVREAVVAALSDDPEMRRMAATWLLQQERRRAREARCHRVTDWLNGSIFAPIAKAATATGRAIKAGYVNCKALTIAAWHVAKAFKEKHCPIVHFHD